MPTYDPDRPYSLSEVKNMVMERLPAANHAWIKDPEGNAAVQAYGSRHLPSQPVYLDYRPSTVKMQIRFTPRRISPGREDELWAAAEASRPALKAAKISGRRQMGRTQDTERDEQWVLTLPERLTEGGYEAIKQFVDLAGSCMGVEPPED